jgi:hypothetical protein
MPYKQSHPDPAFRELIFQMTKADGTPDTGLAFNAGELQLRKPRAFGAAANSSPWVNVDATQRAAVVELGNGAYVYTFTQAELDTPGPGFAFKAQKGTGQYWINEDEIQRAYFGKVSAGTLTAAAFTCDRAEAAAAHWKNALVTFVTGALAGQVSKVGAFTPGVPALITLAADYVFTGAPVVGDIFELVNK